MAHPIPIDGAVLRDLRRLRGLSQEDLANEAGLDRAQISRYECGPQQPPPAHLRWIIAALERIPVSPEQRALIRTPALDAALARTGYDMNRRDVFELGAAAGVLVLAGGPVDLSELSLHQATQELIGRWHTEAPAASLEAARDLLNRQCHALKTAVMREDQRREAMIDAVDVSILAGWSASFVQRPAEAAAWFGHADQLADEVGLDLLRGEVLASKATLHRPLVGDGDARKGLQFARAASPLVGTHGPLAKYVANLEAEMHGALPNEEYDCLQAIHRAFAMPAHGGRDGFYSVRGILSDLPYAQHGWAGGRYAQLGRADEALEHLAEARIEMPADQPRTPTIHYCQMSQAYAVAGNPEPMCHHAHLALDGSRTTGYDVGISRVRHARLQLPDPCADLECVRALDERLLTI